MAKKKADVIHTDKALKQAITICFLMLIATLVYVTFIT